MLDRLLPRTAQDALLRSIDAASRGGVLTPLRGSSASLMTALSFRRRPRPLLVITPKLEDAEAFAADVTTLLPEHTVLHFPEFEILPYDTRSPYKGITGQQVEVLHRVLQGEPCIVITSAKGFKWKVQPAEEVLDYTLSFRKGQEVDFEAIVERFGEMGYYAVPRVEAPGDFARKGGILDIFSVSYENPVRIEFFGDEVESIRFFDATSQRSLHEIDQVNVPPCSPLILSDANVMAAEQAIQGATHAGTHERQRVGDSVRERLHFDGMERFAPWYSERVLLTEYFMEGVDLVWVRPADVVEQLRRLEGEIQHLFEDNVRAGHPVPPPERVYAPNTLLHDLARQHACLYLADVHMGAAPLSRLLAPLEDRPRAKQPEASPGASSGASLEASPEASSGASLEASPEEEPSAQEGPRVQAIRTGLQVPEPYGGRVAALRRDLDKRLRQGQRIHIFCDNAGQAGRLRELLDEVADQIDFPIGELQSGFVLPEHDIVVLTDHEIFERYRRRQRRRKYRVSQGTSAYEDLTPGDFVVHVNYGVARYLGIQKIEVEGHEIDCLQLGFHGGDKIYVTVEQLSLVTKYVGKEGLEPPLTKLGTTAWERTKEKARKAIQEMAQELLELAAVRQTREGHAFSADAHLQKELEASFLYDETPDQLTAIADVKQDMENKRPMDRLICGDVGYGKTEVAIRAAFKAVIDNKQVAVLVPTTILAQQHLTTFRERLADFPVNVDMVSRLRSAREQKETLARLAKGEVDIIIGTHRLLSKDVAFHSLGLIVLDEEHRFGVAHKEKLKRFKQTVDVLTMTATPIPRTLNMALIGLRDMSLINTAPRDRLPVQTEVVPFDEETIIDALLRELDRGGQAYFVHNRVQSIDAMAGYVQRVVPSARVGVAHGQMHERELEKIMVDFLEQKYDVLVSTMIIESGLDIPTVNTLIVNRADAMGLAQLYQLRGRVGRSSHKAYAYFMVPRGGSTTDIARKRLAAMQEFEELGSGLRVAMRDMEIRGAGNILGPEQHGHLVAIGFELYCKLLEQTSAELQGREIPEDVDTRVEVDEDYRIPQRTIPDPEEKMRVYKRVAATLDPGEIAVLREELEDRYGRLPEEAQHLLQVASIRLKAWKCGMARVRVRKNEALLVLRPGHMLQRSEIETVVRVTPNKLAFDVTDSFRITEHLRPDDRLGQVDAFLDTLLDALAATEVA
jgi:transcription-repair coupling factor (superfamily II helicase)